MIRRMETGHAMNGGDAPDWQTQKEEIHCPMCEYNLCGLSTPRCPECGYQFAWKDLLDARTRPHRYLFEHHPEANFKSFWKTAWGGLRPGKFWSELHAGQKSRPGRLFIYWVIVCAISLGPMIASVLTAGVLLAAEAQRTRRLSQLGAPPAFKNFQHFSQSLDAAYPLPPSLDFFMWLWGMRPDFAIIIVLTGIVLAWPWLTCMLLLMLFRISMRRVKIKSIHVFRALIYSFDFGVWTGMLLMVSIPMLMLMVGRTWLFFTVNRWSGNGFGMTELIPFQSSQPSFFMGLPDASFMAQAFGIAGVVLAVGFYRLCIAYRKYLRFDRAIATVLATQVILFLLLAVVAVNWNQLSFYHLDRLVRLFRNQ